MRRLLPFLILLLLSASRLPGQCDFPSVMSDRYRTSALDIAVDADDLWVATSYGISLFDGSSATPRPLRSLALPQTTSRVRAANGLAYIASGSVMYVVRAPEMKIVGQVDTGTQINDLVLTLPYVFAATDSGLVLLMITNPSAPEVAQRLATSRPLISIAQIAGALYAADGDSTIEVFSITIPSFPQRIGSISSLPRSLSVNAAAGRLLVSDGSRSEVFAGSDASMNKIGAISAGSVAVAEYSGSIVFAAGNDRRLRAIELADPASAITLFDVELPASSGTLNRPRALVRSGNSILIAMGDSGLLSFDLANFGHPFPLHSYAAGSYSSVWFDGSAAVFGGSSTGIYRWRADASGALAAAEAWGADRKWTIHDGAAQSVLASSGSMIALWPASGSALPQSSWTLRSPVRSAVLLGTSVFAVTDDRALWRIDSTQPSSAAVNVTPAGSAPSFIARNGSSFALADLNDTGATSLRFFATGDPSLPSAVALFEGAATRGIALSSDRRVAAVTFRGLLIADFGGTTPAVRVVPIDDSIVDYDFAGSSLLLLSEKKLKVLDASGATTRSFALSTGAIALVADDAKGLAFIASSQGPQSVAFRAATSLPVESSPVWPNRFVKQFGATDRWIALYDGETIDVRSALHPATTSIRFPTTAIVDFAIANDSVFALDAAGHLVRHAIVGNSATTTINEGDGTNPLGVTTVGDAAWVTISKSCSTANCEKLTIVYDAASLVRTSIMSGGLVDLAKDAAVGYALFDMPAEIRKLNISDPLHPSLIASVAWAGRADDAPVSIAYAPSVQQVYVAAKKVTAFSSQTLERSGEVPIGEFVADTANRRSYMDQEIVIADRCALIAGRSFNAQLFTIESALAWTPTAIRPLPATGRGVAISSGRVVVLTDYSLEIFGARFPSRGRPVR